MTTSFWLQQWPYLIVLLPLSFLSGSYIFRDWIEDIFTPCPNRQFYITDLYALLFQTCFGIVLYKLFVIDQTIEGLTWFASATNVLQVFWWLLGTRALSRVGIASVWWRLLTLLLTVPLAYGGPFLILIPLVTSIQMHFKGIALAASLVLSASGFLCFLVSRKLAQAALHSVQPPELYMGQSDNLR